MSGFVEIYENEGEEKILDAQYSAFIRPSELYKGCTNEQIQKHFKDATIEELKYSIPYFIEDEMFAMVVWMERQIKQLANGLEEVV